MPRRTSTIAPSLRSAKSDGVNVEMDFKDLPFAVKPKPICDICESRLVFNPVIKSAPLYFCNGCDHRPLCQRCIVELIRNPGDPHEADHYLQAWVQAHVFPLPVFLRQHCSMQTTELGLQRDYGRSWLHSDHAFLPPTGGRLTTRFEMHAPPGIYTVSVDVRTLKRDEEIRSSVLGSTKSMMVKRYKQIPLGSMVFAAQAIDRLKVHAEDATVAHGRYLPDGMVEYEVALTEKQHSQRMTLRHAISIGPDHLLEVHILGTYDTVFFKAGCPFRWWLDQITIEQLGSQSHVASMGDLKTRANVLAKQTRQHHDHKFQKNMALVGQSVQIAGNLVPKILGTRTITKTATNALSGFVKLGATAMKSDEGKTQTGSGGHQGASAPIVYNQYFVVGSDDGAQQQQQQQQVESDVGYEKSEIEVLKEGEYYEYQATQLQLTEHEGVEQWGYQYREERQH